MAETIGAAFVGCSHPHIFYRLKLLAAAPDVRLVGCYDPDAELRAEFERRYGLCAFDSAEALLDQPGVNFAIIEGWDPDNPGYARLATQREQAILLEKPGAPNLAAMRALVADLRGKPIPFQVAYQLRYSPVMAHVRRILAEDVLGPLTLARFHAAAPVGAAREPWQSVPGGLGGVVYTDGCHMIDLIVHLLGVPRQVKGMLLTLPAGQSVRAEGFKRHTFAGQGETVEMPLGGLMYEDAGAALLDYGDRLATFDLTGWEAHPWVEAWHIELHGTEGALYAGPQPPRYRLYLRAPRAGYQAGWHTWQGSDQSGDAPPGVNVNYANEMAHMLDRVRTWDIDNMARLAEAEAVITVLDGIYRSHREGRPVAIERPA